MWYNSLIFRIIIQQGNKVKPPSANVCNSVLDTNKTVRRKYNGQTYAVSPADAMADKVRFFNL